MTHIGETPIGRRIRDRRREMNMTQHELAMRAEVSQSYIALIESGERTPSSDAVDAIARALGCTFEEDKP